MIKQKQLYRGKAKSVFETDNPEQVIMEYRDDISAFNAEKLANLTDKGKVNNYFNAYIMEKLAQAGIKTHFIKIINERESLTHRLDMIPVECVVRNIAAGSICKRLGIEEGRELTPATFEFFYKDDALGDPMINDYHIISFGYATPAEIAAMKELTFKVNTVLQKLFLDAGILLVDYKLEFGRFHGEVLLGDEFTPDGCRLWDVNTREKLDKDRFRRDMGDVVESYKLVADRLGVLIA